jgi:hypothetical protein
VYANKCSCCNLVAIAARYRLTLAPVMAVRFSELQNPASKFNNAYRRRPTRTPTSARSHSRTHSSLVRFRQPRQPAAQRARIPAYSISLASCGELDASASPTAYPNSRTLPTAQRSSGIIKHHQAMLAAYPNTGQRPHQPQHSRSPPRALRTPLRTPHNQGRAGRPNPIPGPLLGKMSRLLPLPVQQAPLD